METGSTPGSGLVPNEQNARSADTPRRDLNLRTPRVMLSSTVSDLVEIRDRAHRVCTELGLKIESMEDNIAMAESARDFSIGLVERADVYIGIVAQNAGSKPVGDELNYTHLEYERARHEKLPRLLFLSRVDDDASLDVQIGNLRKKMLDDSKAVSAFFANGDDFETRLRNSLINFIEKWRRERGLNPDQAELSVASRIVNQNEAVDVTVTAPDEVIRGMTVRFADQTIELDEVGMGSASATVVGNHTLELVYGAGADEIVVHQRNVTVALPAGPLVDLAMLGAFIALAVWIFLGFSHPRALEPPHGVAATIHFKDDLLGHVLTVGALIGAVWLGAVFRRARRGFGEVIVEIDRQWQSIRWWVMAFAIIIMSMAAYFNATFITGKTDTWWWSEDAGSWAVWLISFAYFLLALAPILLLIVRLGLALRTATQTPTRVLSYDPASADGHFGLAWLGNTMFAFLALASIPLSLAAAVQFGNYDQSGLGVPVAIILGIVVIGLLGVFPLRDAYPRLEAQRQRASQAEKKKLRKLEEMHESALTERERDERITSINEAKLRIQAIEAASPIVMGRLGWACAAAVGLSLMTPIVYFIFRG
jgi:hypothetical protein